MDDELELTLYEKVKKIIQPIPETITIEGIHYLLDEKGKVRVYGEG